MNIAQNLQAYLTPIFIVVLIAYVFWCGYSMTGKKHRKTWKKLQKGVEAKRQAVKSLTVAVGLRTVVLVFLIFAYFFAYAPNQRGLNVIPQESGRMEQLNTLEIKEMTEAELQKDADERRDVTGTLDQVGSKEALAKEEEENAKKIEETLKKYN